MASGRLLPQAAFVVTCLLLHTHLLLQAGCAVLPAEVLQGFSVANSGPSEAWLGPAAARPVLASRSGAFALAFVAPSRDARRVFRLSVVSLQGRSGGLISEVVWRARQEVVENAVVSLRSGGLELSDGATGGAAEWVVGEGRLAVAGMRMLDSGNLVLVDAAGGAVWESFHHPTDTLLPGQNFTDAMRLTVAEEDGTFSLAMRADGMALWSGPAQTAWVYWEVKAMQEQRPIDAGGAPIYARLDAAGFLAMYQNETQRVHFISLRSYNVWGIPRRLRLERNGNLRAYYWDAAPGEERWRLDWEAVRDVCHLPAPCGRYGICSGGGNCTCPGDGGGGHGQLFMARSLNGSSEGDEVGVAMGCRPRGKALSCGSGGGGEGQAMMELVGVDHVGNQFAWSSELVMSLEDCRRSCLENCSCIAAFFHNETGACFHHSAEQDLGSLFSVSSQDKLGYLKVEANSSSGAAPAFIPVVPGDSRQNAPRKSPRSNRVAMAAIFTITLLSFTVLLVLIAEMIWRTHKMSKERRQDSLLSKVGFAL